ncbi:MAG: hypothetical protein AAB403_15740 [Planctomycetota bacterium]
MGRTKVIVLFLGAAMALTFAMSLAVPTIEEAADAAQPVAGDTVADRPLLLFGLWGFGDFQGRRCRTESGGTEVQVPKGHQMKTWSGCSMEWKDSPLDIRGYNTIVVKAHGAGTILFSDKHDQKMMKWVVRWPGQDQDKAIKCTDSDLRASSDEEWVVPVDRNFEYRLPDGAVTAGQLTKIQFTLLEGATYGDVRFRAWLTTR